MTRRHPKRRVTSLPITSTRWSDDLQAYRFPDGQPIEIFALLAAHEGNALRDLKAATTACLTSSVPVRFREFIILRVCAALGCRSEWDVHATLFADAAGLTDADLTLLADGATVVSAFSPEDRCAVAMVDDLLSTGTVASETWDALVGQLTTSQALDSVMIAGQYLKVAWMANCLGMNEHLGSWPLHRLNREE